MIDKLKNENSLLKNQLAQKSGDIEKIMLELNAYKVDREKLIKQLEIESQKVKSLQDKAKGAQIPGLNMFDNLFGGQGGKQYKR